MSLRLLDLLQAASPKPTKRNKILALVPDPVYDDGRTKQSFKDETDINRILQRAQKTGTISHLAKHEAQYGDFEDFDFFEQTLQITRGNQIFADLPSELRDEFHQSPQEFFKYVNDQENKAAPSRNLPELAEPGRQNMDVSGRTEPAADPPAPADPPADPPA